MIILSVDLGQTRTGLAVCDSSETFAFPRGIIKEYNREKLFQKISQMAISEKAQLIVVGLPKNMDGSEGFKAEECRAAAKEIENISGIPVELYDERCTTIIAHADLRNNGINGKKRKDIVDSVAATVILENYLTYRKNKK